MRTIHLKTARGVQESIIICRKQVIEKELASRRDMFLKYGGIIFTDENVYSLYGEKIKKYLGGVPVHIMAAGEENKNEKTLFSLLGAMAEAGLGRGSTLIAFGGGVVGDIGGLAASLYMRGINCIQVPTTLLAQVDSSVGGKTAIDFQGVKNLIGTFWPPSLVYVDPAFLKTLPGHELRNGLGEIIKHGALCPSIFEKLYLQRKNLFDLDFLAKIIPENIAFKASIVKQDPYEAGLRKCLNLGHTTAHALELSGINRSHGECVLAGIIFESEIARRYCTCEEAFLQKLKELCLIVLGTMPKVPNVRNLRAAQMDKKNKEQGKVVLTVPTDIGKYELLELPFDEYESALRAAEERMC